MMKYLQKSKWMTRKEVERNIPTGVYLHKQGHLDCLWYKIESMIQTPNGSFKYHVCVKGVWGYYTASEVNGFLTQAQLTEISMDEIKALGITV